MADHPQFEPPTGDADAHLTEPEGQRIPANLAASESASGSTSASTSPPPNAAERSDPLGMIRSIPPPVITPLRPPVEDPVWSGWDVLLIALLTFVVVLVAQYGEVAVAQRLWFRHSSFFEAAQKVEQRPILVIAAQFLLYIPLALFMLALLRGKYRVPFWRAIRWNWPRSQWWLLLGAVMLIALSFLQSLLPMPKDTPFEHLFDRPRDAYLISIIAVTLGPLMEEVFFRGLLYPVLARRIGVVWGVLLTALPFGLIHLPQYGWAWGAGLVIFLVGVVCGAVRAATKSVGASFLVHVGYNGAQMVIALVATRGFQHMEKAWLTIR